MKLLVVEDDQETSEAICEYLGSKGFEVSPVYDGRTGLQFFVGSQFDLVVLDVMLPGLTGLALLHEIRNVSDTPVIMLTAIDDEYTQVASFDGLADDYLTKPFSLVVLERRIRAILRRHHHSKNRAVWSHKNLTVDFEACTARRDSTVVELTARELTLLKLFVDNPGRVLTRKSILDEVWGEKSVFDRTIDSHIKNLRKKLGLDFLITVTGVGYKLELDA